MSWSMKTVITLLETAARGDRAALVASLVSGSSWCWSGSGASRCGASDERRLRPASLLIEWRSSDAE
jgi:hypothetical protein